MTLLLLTPENDDLGNCPRLSDLHCWSVSNLDLLIWVPRTASLDSSQSIMRYMLTPDAAANWETEVGLSSEIRLETSSDLQKGARRSCRHFFPREINSEIFFYGWISNSFVLYEYHETIICKLKPKAKNQWDDNAQIGLGARRRRGITLP